MDYLNLDELPTKTLDKTIILKGVKHVMEPISVESFINSAKKRAEDLKPAEQVEHLCEMIRAVFPTIPTEELGALQLPKLNAIMDFINKSADEINAKGAAGSKAKPDAVNGEVLPPGK